MVRYGVSFLSAQGDGKVGIRYYLKVPCRKGCFGGGRRLHRKLFLSRGQLFSLLFPSLLHDLLGSRIGKFFHELVDRKFFVACTHEMEQSH